MGTALVGGGNSALFFFSQPALSILSPFTPIQRLSLVSGVCSNWIINGSSDRLTTMCKHANNDFPGCERDAADERMPEEKDQEDWVTSPSSSPYQILGIDNATCSPDRLKAAFRARVKKFHPDVYRGSSNSDEIILRIINAYEMLSNHFQFESIKRSASDPFEEPESEACDIFVNELECVGRGCPYSCVKRAPCTFSFTCENGTARAVSQGHLDDYQVQLAAGQCPRKCIYYVTPSQRIILQDVLQRVLNNPFDMGEVAFLESLISKAIFENRRYQKQSRKTKLETEYVDWS